MTQISFFNQNKISSSFVNPKKPRILSILEDCHNYIYANEGILKEKLFEKLLKFYF